MANDPRGLSFIDGWTVMTRWLLKILCFILPVISCTKSQAPKDLDSQVSALASCPLRSAIRPNPMIGSQPRSRSQFNQPPIPVVPSRPFVVQRLKSLPKAFSPSSTLFGVEIELPLKEGAIAPLRRFNDEVIAKCEQCPELCSRKQGAIILRDPQKSPERIYIYIDSDPGVIEILTNPMTYSQVESWRNELDELVFATARDFQKKSLLDSPDQQRNRWSGHINVSWPGLIPAVKVPDFENMNLLLNYFVDLQNSPELGMGVLGGDIRNATPLAFGSLAEQTLLKEAIRNYREGHILDTVDLAKSLLEAHPDSFKGRYRSGRFSLVNLDNIVNLDFQWGYEQGARIELRGFFSPRNVDDMLANFRIINGRLDYLHRKFQNDKPQSLDFIPPKIDENYLRNATLESHKTEGLIGGLSPAAAAQVYIRYLRESGLDPRRESQYLRDRDIRRAVLNQLRCASAGFLSH
jgi:hypothetical protein